MKAISLVKYFTLVLIFISGVSVRAAGSCGIFANKEECIASAYRTLKAKCAADPVNAADPVKKQACISNANSEAQDSGECAACDSKSDIAAEKGTCDTKFENYQSKLERTNEECGKVGGGGITSCTQKANICSGGLDLGGSDIGASITNLMGLYMGVQNGSGLGAGCMLQDDTLEDRKSAIDDQIQRLEDEKVESVTKQAELDDELNKKKSDVDTQIADLETEFNKAAIERKSNAAKEANDLQKSILASEKKKRDNLTLINDKQTQIANLAFGIQQIVIESSDLRISKTCTDKVNAMKATFTATVAGPDGKKKAPKYSLKEAQNIKSNLKLEEQTCLQSEALKKQAQIKGVEDTKRKLLADIDTATKANQDEDTAIAQAKKQIEDKKALMTEEEQKQLDIKNKKLDSLSKSITEMAAIVARKKKALDTKIANRDAQIKALVIKKQNLKPKLSGVTSSIATSRSAAKAYIAACCMNADKKKNHTGCGQVKSDAGDFNSGDSGSGGVGSGR